MMRKKNKEQGFLNYKTHDLGDHIHYILFRSESTIPAVRGLTDHFPRNGPNPSFFSILLGLGKYERRCRGTIELDLDAEADPTTATRSHCQMIRRG